MEKEFPMGDIVAIVKKNIILIVTSVLLCIVLSVLATTYLIKPVYEASTQVLVNQKKEQNPTLNIGDVQSNIQLVNTYRVIIKSPRILEVVLRENPEYSLEQLNKIIDVNSESDSQVINITVRSNNLKEAVRIANYTGKVFEQEVGSIMQIENASVLSWADVDYSKKPIFPILSLNIAIAVLIGLLIAFVILFFKTILNNTITSELQLEEITDVLSLGTVRSISKKEAGKINVPENRESEEIDHV